MSEMPEEVSSCLDRCRVIAEGIFRHRMTTNDWRFMLLNQYDRPTIRGHVRQLVGKRIGPGVYEIRLESPPKETP